MNISRRNFIKGTSSLAVMPFISNLSYSQNLLNPIKTVINVFLEGGPDFRHLFAPIPNTDYGNAFWKARSSLFGINPNNSNEFQEAFEQNYDQISFDSVEFGILKKADWLKNKILEGRVAIINNVFGSTSRDHPYSTLVWTSGDHDALPQELCRSGWGGRLASYNQKRILSVTEQPLLFCNGPHPSNPLNHSNPNLIDAPNMENFSFTKKAEWFENTERIDREYALFRSLRSYYQSKRNEVSSGETFSSFVETEKVIRSLGDQVDERLKNQISPQGGFISSTEGDLNSYQARRPLLFDELLRGNQKAFFEYFAMQLLNTYYGIACQDLLDFNVISLMLEGFDTHAIQRDEEEGIEIRIQELFGNNRGISILDNQLFQDYPQSKNNLIYIFSGEFGRQLKSNGAGGTEHGNGNTVLVYGDQVIGGIYGELFPQSEIATMQDWNQHIEGKTSFERVFAAISEWAVPGSGISIFPLHNQRPLESGNALNFLQI